MPVAAAETGFADSAEMLAKARIVTPIGRIIQAHKLTQAEAGALLSIDQPKVSRYCVDISLGSRQCHRKRHPV